MKALSPYSEDTVIALAAEKAGLSMYRRVVVRVIDESLIPAKLMRRVPDYAKIRSLIDGGVPVPGVEATNEVEYVLRRMEQAA